MTKPEELFTYNDALGGVRCAKYHIVPGVGQTFRRRAILDLMDTYIPSPDAESRPRYLEIGCGTGVFAYEAYRRGCQATAHDLNQDALALVDDVFNTDKKRIEIKAKIDKNDSEFFDYIGLYEVLEHIEDDAAALRGWTNVLKPGGVLFLSVPAHEKYWNHVDDYAGHVRRYEKAQLIELCADCGLEPLNIYCFGYPFTNILQPLVNLLLHRRKFSAKKSLTKHERTLESGIDRKLDWRFSHFTPYSVLGFMSRLQRVFYSGDRGYGYCLAARKMPKSL
ncbi:MAG: class I SAM-dependent methyltransferase [Desulfobulbaceae bacterium]|jgi:SAM-dependent methyltransferase|nr:class I SAM-dependent methyltransferase [Desulfobulbaceae bacterium]